MHRKIGSSASLWRTPPLGFVWLICVLLKFFFFALLIIQQIREGWVVLSKKKKNNERHKKVNEVFPVLHL